MSVNFADDTSVDVLTKEDVKDTNTEEADREARFDDLIEGGEQPPADEPDDQPEEEAEEVEAPAPVAEGPSLAMRAVARQANIPDALVDIARDDAQLHEMVALATAKEDRAPEPEPVEFNVELPEEEYGADDAVRKQFNSMKDHFEGQIKTFQGDMTTVVDLVKGLEKRMSEQVQQQQSSAIADFDSALDRENSPVLGQLQELSEAGRKIRGAVYDEMENAHRADPTLSYEDTVRAAINLALPGYTDTNKARKQRQSIRAQHRAKLGSGNAKPAPSPEPSVDEMFTDFIEVINARNIAKK